MNAKLLTRDDFREGVFKRDKRTCVVYGCNEPAVDAHHIIERRLWTEPDEFGGYFMENGASVCECHHKLAERDFITPQTLREFAGIDTIVLPNSLRKTSEAFDYGEVRQWHTKWGDELKHPTRLFCKYPSTRYFPFSPGVDELDIKEHGFAKLENFVGVPLFVSIKMDGSNVVLRHDGVAARNGDTALHSSFDALKAWHAGIKYVIPEHIQLFGEWLYAKHSIHYTDLTAHFQLFRAYDTRTEMFLGVGELKAYASLIGAVVVPVPFPGGQIQFNSEHEVYKLIAIAEDVIAQGHEGIVVTSLHSFHYDQFGDRVAKYVRKNHVSTDEHWSKQQIIKNTVRK